LVYATLGDLLKMWGEKRLSIPQQEQGKRRLVIEINERKSEGIATQMNLFPPIDDANFETVCALLDSGKSLTESNVCGNGNPLRNRGELHKVQDWFVKQGLARWNATKSTGEPERRQGLIWDSVGKAVIKKVATAPPHQHSDSSAV